MLMAVGAAGVVNAQVPQARVTAFARLAYQIGTTNEVSISGTDLDDATQLWFADSRLRSQPRAGGFTLVIPPQMSPGVVEARFVGRFGVSTPHRLWLGTEPEWKLPATNHSRETAFLLPAKSGVNGRLEAGKVAWFRLPSPAPQPLLLHVAASALDSLNEPDLAVLDSDGHELARSRRGGSISLARPPAGELFITLHDLRYRGGDGFGYRLTHGAMAATAQARLNNALPSLARSSLRSTATANGPAPLLLAPTNGLLEIKPPAEVRGRFARRGETTGVTFSGHKGEVWWIELASDRLGEATDPFVLVQRVRATKGDAGESPYVDVLEVAKLDANFGGTEYPTGCRDVAGKFEAPEDATYRVILRDQFAQTPRATLHPWQLSVRRETPGASLVVVPAPLPRQNDNDRQIYATASNLRRGETVALKVLAYRHDGFDGEIELLTPQLPPGVTASSTRIQAGQRVGAVVLTAADTLTSGVDLFPVQGRYRVGTNTVLSAARAGTAQSPAADWDQERSAVVLSDYVVLGRIGAETSAVRLEPTTNGLEVAVGGKVNLPFQILRREGFTAGFKLKAAGRTELDKVKELTIADNATNGVVELNLAEAALPVGTHTVWLEGRAPGKYRNQPEAIDVAKAELKAAEEALAKADAAGKPASEKRKQEAADRVKAAEERAKPRDVFTALVSRPFTVRVVPAPPAK